MNSMIEIPENVPETAKLLKGVGASSWFYIEKLNSLKNTFRVIRYSMKGEIECDVKMINTSHHVLKLTKPYEITFVSHCGQCTIIQNNKTILLKDSE